MSKVFFGLYDNWKQAAVWFAVGIPTVILALYLFDSIGGGATKDRIQVESEYAYQGEIGNPTVRIENASPALFKKKLGTSVGAAIEIPKFFTNEYNPSEWETGGKMYIYNDYSLGNEFAITCALSPDLGDRLMADNRKREIDIYGTISSYSSDRGLIIDPCFISRDEYGALD